MRTTIDTTKIFETDEDLKWPNILRERFQTKQFMRHEAPDAPQHIFNVTYQKEHVVYRMKEDENEIANFT